MARDKNSCIVFLGAGCSPRWIFGGREDKFSSLILSNPDVDLTSYMLDVDLCPAGRDLRKVLVLLQIA